MQGTEVSTKAARLTRLLVLHRLDDRRDGLALKGWVAPHVDRGDRLNGPKRFGEHEAIFGRQARIPQIEGHVDGIRQNRIPCEHPPDEHRGTRAV
jgi:hypothetical protein